MTSDEQTRTAPRTTAAPTDSEPCLYAVSCGLPYGHSGEHGRAEPGADVERLRRDVLAAIVALPQPTLGLAGGINRGAAIDAISAVFAALQPITEAVPPAHDCACNCHDDYFTEPAP